MNATLTFLEVSFRKEPFYNLPYRYSKWLLKYQATVYVYRQKVLLSMLTTKRCDQRFFFSSPAESRIKRTLNIAKISNLQFN